LTPFVSYDTKISMDTKTINLRDLPEELVRRAKACAALHGMTLKDFVMYAITKALEQDIPATSLPLAALTLPKTKHRKRTYRGS
jgi:uncharacterized protein (DUF1778 family)